MDLLLEDRKVGAQLLRVQRWASRHGHGAIVPGHRVMKLPATAVIALALLPLVAGCGGSSKQSSAPGAKVFASAGCGGCHTLSAAGSKGQIGPNLDELKPDASTVERQV